MSRILSVYQVSFVIVIGLVCIIRHCCEYIATHLYDTSLLSVYQVSFVIVIGLVCIIRHCCEYIGTPLL